MSEKQAKQLLLLTRLMMQLSSLTNAPRPKSMPEEPKYASYVGNMDLEIANKEFDVDLKEFQAEVERRKSFHDDASKTIRRVFYSLLGTSLFCLLTLASTPDANLISAGAVVTLPVLNYPIGFADFLVVGPLLLIALTVYLHIFVAQHRMIAIPAKYRLAMLPNFDAFAARLTVWFAHYWLVPATLVHFVWKAWPRVFEGWLVFACSIVVVAVLAALQIRRCRSGWRRWAVPFLIASIVIYAGGLYTSTTQRTLNLFKAELDGQDLRGANLSRADLAEARLEGTNLFGVNLNEANLQKSNLKQANLFAADLSDANLSDANLKNANLIGANLAGADLTYADLSDADLRTAHLSEAILINANLSGVKLAFVDLSVVDLRGTNLSGAKLQNARALSQTKLDAACGDTQTKLPKGLTIAPCEPEENEPKE